MVERNDRKEDNASRLFKQQLNEIFEEKQIDDDLINSNDTIRKKELQELMKSERQTQMNRVFELLKDYDWFDKFEWVHQQKLKGNRLFRKELLQEAADAYLYGLMGIELQQTDIEKQRRMQEEQIFPLLINLATTMIRLGKYDIANAISDKVLEIDSHSQQGNIKKAESLIYCGDYYKAVEFLQRTAELLRQKNQNKKDKMRIQKIYKTLQQFRKKQQGMQYKKGIKVNPNEKPLREYLEIKDDYDQVLIEEPEDTMEFEEDEYGCIEEQLYGSQKGNEENDFNQSTKNQNPEQSILYYDDQFETIKNYVGPFSYLLFYPYLILNKIAISLGCKKRKKSAQMSQNYTTEEEDDDGDDQYDEDDEEEQDGEDEDDRKDNQNARNSIQNRRR